MVDFSFIGFTVYFILWIFKVKNDFWVLHCDFRL